MTMSRDEARVLISSLIEWYTEDIAERLGLSMGKDEYMDALEVLWHGPDGELISRADAMGTVQDHFNADGFKGYDDGQKMMDRLKSLPSAEAAQGWIPFTRRPMTEEEQKDYPNCTFMFDCVLPDDGDEILVSNGRFVWMDVFCNDIDGCYLDSGDDIGEDMAWMPMPKPYKGGEK